ncbi:hypothetical protein B0H19DRAFT_1080527 [Mycena capillaripes]|nr:hypothetical protein B0H19DRAFT_1080527 [Mycena capillaripes]
MCSPGTSYTPATATEEVELIAKKYLLQLSRVCSRWHEIAMFTPRLWSILTLDTSLWDGSTKSSTLLALVAASLNRGANFPLNITLVVELGHPNEALILDLLSQHSYRWRKISLCIDPRSLIFLANAIGNLPVLDEHLLYDFTESDDPYADDLFATAPRLKTVSIVDWPCKLPMLPWGQLRHFQYINRESGDLLVVPQVLPLLSDKATFELRINISSITLPLELPPILSNISILFITSTVDSDEPTSDDESTVDDDSDESNHTHTMTIFGALWGCSTWPSLKHLRFGTNWHDLAPRWNQTYFMDFAFRSSLQTTLGMCVIDVLVEEHELLECLFALPLLEDLRIWDCEDQHCPVVITDSLLHRLALRRDHPNLIPRLNWLYLASLFRFQDDALEDFITSRITHLRYESVFEAKIYWLSRRDREFTPEFSAKLSGLGGGISFSLITGPYRGTE